MKIKSKDPAEKIIKLFPGVDSSLQPEPKYYLVQSARLNQ